MVIGTMGGSHDKIRLLDNLRILSVAYYEKTY